MKKIIFICAFSVLLNSCGFEKKLVADRNESVYEEYTVNEKEFSENNNEFLNDMQNDLNNTENTEEKDYILPQSNYKLINNDDIKNFSATDFRIAINEIYARHGLIFMTEEYKIYFNNKSWYKENIQSNEFDESVFNEYEKTNLYFLLKSEKEFIYQNSKTKCIYKIYDAVYRDERAWYIDEEDKGYVFYHLKISNVTDYTFDFSIIEDKDGSNQKEIFPVSTAKFIDNGDMAMFYDGDTELKFTFPNDRESLPDIVQIKIDGLDFLENVTFAFNGVPGHEFN